MPDDSPDPKPPRTPNGENPPPKPPVRLPRGGAFSWVVIFGLVLMLLFLLNQSRTAANRISISDFDNYLANHAIRKIVVKEHSIVGELKEAPATSTNQSKLFECNYPFAAQNFEDVRKRVEKTDGAVKIEYQPENNLLFNMMISLIPWILVFAVGWFFVFRQLRQTGAGAGMLGNFGRSRHRITTKEHTHVTFADVAGVDEAKEEVAEIVEFLKNPKRFQRLGGRIPRGVLLIGEPGCGKTMLAKAIAGEADVPFFSISGSDFVEMFVGVGASRVRDLFKQAKENAPCIIFLDEIDAVGRRRGMGYNGGGHDEREQTLNAILVEMDGFDTSDQVIVIAATNRADVLDPALIRPGRFDRQVYVSLPDMKGRFEILKVHAKKVRIAPPVEPKLNRIARGTSMFSGADLAAIINEAALLGTMAGKDAIELDDLEEARDKVRWGRSRKSRQLDEQDRVLTAYHEAGHALVQALLKDADPLHKVSIIPRGQALGTTFSLPEKDRLAMSRKYIEAYLRVACAGRIAEELLGDDMNSGAAGDIQQATRLVRRMVSEWGMSERLGFINYGDDPSRTPSIFEGASRECSDETARIIDEEVKRIIDMAYADARRIVHENRDKVEAIAQALLKYETIDGDDVRKLMNGEALNKPTVADLIAAEQDRRRTERAAPLARPVERPPGGVGPMPEPA
ncbi:MAG: ATP-dependent zinc metalloprotease FtsH [Phycisphaerae bacterium]|nr:ATP-dependent zinc metalloprotease FtsH [Phycisphaerae bacterium]